jgi:hypothetical protein
LFFDTLGAERIPLNASWRGERQLDPRCYEREVPRQRCRLDVKPGITGWAWSISPLWLR